MQETNGVILYQEQVMKIAQVLAGYTLGQAHMLRRAMGKKKPEEMARQRQIFLEGARKQKVPADKAEQIFDLMEKFAGYGFNKSHSAAYALISYQTAYLKAHYPQAFMAATLSCDMGSTDKVATLVNDCRSMGIEVLPPDINASDWEFMPEEEGIRYGLGAIKGVGEAVIRELVRTRNAGGAFASFEEMILRLPERTMNKRTCEALIKAGAMHAVIPHLHAGLEGLAEAMDEASRRRREKLSQQSALFEVAEPSGEGMGLFPDVPEWSQGECLQAEREVLGFYLTGHPLEEYLVNCSGLADLNLSQLGDVADQSGVVIPVGVSSIREHKGGRGTMAFIQVEDLFGRAEAVCFAKVYEASRDIWHADQPLLLAARVDASRDEPALLVEAVEPLAKILPELVVRVRVESSSMAWDEATIAGIEALKHEKPGNVRFQFHVRLPDGSIAELESKPILCWDRDVESWFKECFGADAVHIQCRTWKPETVAGKGANSRNGWGNRQGGGMNGK
jgi:DNA polymerase-3 subunit alpha